MAPVRELFRLDRDRDTDKHTHNKPESTATIRTNSNLNDASHVHTHTNSSRATLTLKAQTAELEHMDKSQLIHRSVFDAEGRDDRKMGGRQHQQRGDAMGYGDYDVEGEIDDDVS